ncbi:ATP-binding cassette domain-containing protein [Poseidonibacter antarcticus]|uniref:ATP-binding cassette domain-containing protein n=1 Tax=Poseidonibacter antarcticus TaxID=2478538 RepID=UPI000EF55044|nr:ATP-binding cassette domain-containing protein [Poseidonibacter antarcticus]
MAFYLQNESISYLDNVILDSLTLEIKKGEKVALLGKSGSGKSTLIKRLYELEKEQSSYIPQELGLVNNLSVFHNVYIARLDDYSTFYNIRNLIKPASKEVDEIRNILKDFDLEDKLFVKNHDLSGGQKQRTAIARSLFNQKKILLADEPISALDEYLSSKVLEVLDKKYETIVCAIHNVDLAVKHFQRVIGLKNGKILVDKKCSQLTDDDRQKLYYVCD